MRLLPFLLAWQASGISIEGLIKQTREKRLAHLEEQAMDALRAAAEAEGQAVFPNAFIAGDSVVTYLLHKLGYLQSGVVKVMVVDTLHLFPETMLFLRELENKYSFNASVFMAAGVTNKKEYDEKYGADLWKLDIEQYDKVCKVEPFQRGLNTLEAKVMINGRRRDHGAERAHIEIAEVAPIGGGMAKLNPLAFWTFEDIFDYAKAHDVQLHPLHADGYPSIGDAKDTIRVPEDGSVRWVNNEFVGDKRHWLDYASERKGRFTGLTNKDGTAKTECGIHVRGAEQTFMRDLWPSGSSKVAALVSREQVKELQEGGRDSVVIVYAPWSKDCQDIESHFEALANDLDGQCKVAKYRGDEDTRFAEETFQADTYPTVSVVKSDGRVIKYDEDVHDSSSLRNWISSQTGIDCKSDRRVR